MKWTEESAEYTRSRLSPVAHLCCVDEQTATSQEAATSALLLASSLRRLASRGLLLIICFVLVRPRATAGSLVRLENSNGI